jgi:hypothetical protein
MDGPYTPSYGVACARMATPGHVVSETNDSPQAELPSLASTYTMIELLRSADAVVVSSAVPQAAAALPAIGCLPIGARRWIP